VSAFLDVNFVHADFVSAMVVVAASSFSFVGIGMMTAVLPLISPEKGTQLGFIAQGLLLVISGVYYPVSVLPQWMQWLSVVSPATYTLEGARNAVLDGAGVAALWGDIWPLLLIGVIAIPAGLAVFSAGERYAKRHGRLKRSG
jgi:ABC-2 type transport system permease protein